MPTPKKAAASAAFQAGDRVRAICGDWGAGTVRVVKADPKRAEVHRQRIRVAFDDRHDDDTKDKDLPEFSAGALVQEKA